MTHSIKKKLTLICMMIFVLSLSVIVLGQNTSAATTYTVTLNGNGGSPNITQRTVVKNGTYGSALTTPSRTGYTFKGWYTKASGGSKVTSASRIIKNANHTLYAHWSAKSYQVSFNVNGGSGSIPPINVTYGSKYGSLTSPSRTNYTFLGWYTTPSGNGAQITSSTIMNQTKPHTLYARWRKIQYSIYLNANGGSPSTSITVDKNGKYKNLHTPSRTGYTFDGWYTKASGGDKVSSSTKIIKNDNHTLYAHWTAKEYKISFDVNGGSGKITGKKIKFDKKYGSLPTPQSRTGYNFAGWYTAASGGVEITSSTVMNRAQNHTLYAQWKKKEYSVYLDANGGSPSCTIKVKYNGKYKDLTTPTRTGYKFAGWFTEAGGGTEITTSTKIIKNGKHTLYAHWTPRKYKVSFDSQGGTSVDSKKVKYKEKYGTLPTPTKKGYTLKGWYTKASGGAEITSTVTMNRAEDHTLYAHWKVAKYDVYLNANGGSPSDTIKVKHNETYEKLHTPTRTGYKFKGWYTKEKDGDKVTNSTKIVKNKNHTLFAHWAPNKYTISFNVNGGSGSIPSISKKFGETYGSLTSPSSRDGYDFLGWYTEGGAKITKDTVMNQAKDHTLHARWQIRKYAVTLCANGGSPNSAIQVNHNGTYGAMTSPSRDGHAFAGWYTEGGKKVEMGSKIVKNANHTLYAHWTAKQYTVSFDSQGGGLASPKTVTYNEKYGDLPTPERVGYKFSGWYTAAKGGDKVTKDTIVKKAENHTLFAHWDAKEYYVTLDYNYGGKKETISVTFGSKYKDLPDQVKREGYHFKGWYNQYDDKVTSSTVCEIANHHTLKAKWEKMTLNVNYPAAYEPLEFHYDGSANNAMGGANGYFYFEVESDGTWSTSSSTGRLIFSTDTKNWSSSVERTGSYKLYVKSTTGGEAAYGVPESGTMSITTGAITKTYRTLQETKDTVIYSHHAVLENIKEDYHDFPEYKLTTNYTSKGWEKLSANRDVYYLVKTEIKYDEESRRTYAYSQAFVVEGTNKNNLFMRQYTAYPSDDLIQGVKYGMGDGLIYLSQVCVDALKYVTVKNVDDIYNAFRKAGGSVAYDQIIKDGYDLLTLIKENYVIIRDTETKAIMVTDLLYTDTWTLYDTMNDANWSTVYGEIKTFFGLYAKDNLAKQYSEERGIAFFEYQEAIQKAGFSGFDVWPELFSMLPEQG